MINALITDPKHWLNTVVAMSGNNGGDFHRTSAKAVGLGVTETETFDTWISRVKDAFAVFASILVIAASVWWCITFFTGGLKSQDQFAIQNLTSQVGALQTTLSTISTQISNMPRPADYAAVVDHLRSLDQQNTALGDQLTTIRIDMARLSTQIGSIPGANPSQKAQTR